MGSPGPLKQIDRNRDGGEMRGIVVVLLIVEVNDEERVPDIDVHG